MVQVNGGGSRVRASSAINITNIICIDINYLINNQMLDKLRWTVLASNGNCYCGVMHYLEKYVVTN